MRQLKEIKLFYNGGRGKYNGYKTYYMYQDYTQVIFSCDGKFITWYDANVYAQEIIEERRYWFGFL